MTLLPPPRPRYQGESNQYRAVQHHHVAAQKQDRAMTLGQYWRSDSRVTPGRKRPKWAGRTALWLGIFAAIVYFVGGQLGGESAVPTQVATSVGFVSMFFAAVAIIAGIGRGLGIFALVFAVAGNAVFWAWLGRALG